MGEFREEAGTSLCRALRPWSEFGFCSESKTSPLLTVLCRSDNVIKDYHVLTAVKNCEACVYVLLQEESQETLRGEKSQETEYSIKYATDFFKKRRCICIYRLAWV